MLKYLTIIEIIDFELGNEKEFIFSLSDKNGTNKVLQRIEPQTFRASERIGAWNPKVRGMIAHEDSEFSLFSTLMTRRKHLPI